MAKKPRLKSVAMPAPQSRAECGVLIGRIGELEREIVISEAAQSEYLSVVKLRYSLDAVPKKAELKALQKAVQAYCEANRNELTGDGKRKTVKFASGVVRWRTTPWSVSLKGVDEVIGRLQGLGLRGFLREKIEVNKEAILVDAKSRELAAGIDGITIGKKEEFVVEPISEEIQ